MTARRLTLEFAPQPRWRLTPASTVLAAAVLVVVAQGLHAADGWRARQRDIAQLQALEARPTDGAARRTAVKADPATVARIRSAEGVVHQLAMPWVDLLGSVEGAPQDAVALLAFEPSSAKQTVRLTAEARDATAMLGYVRALQQDGRLASVVLASHQLQAQAPGTPLRFQVQAVWGIAP